jgi:hypothetical protein
MNHADNNINLLVNEITSLLKQEEERKKEEDAYKETLAIFEKQINIIVERQIQEYTKDYNIYNIKIMLQLLLRIIKQQHNDLLNMKELIKNKLK